MEEKNISRCERELKDGESIRGEKGWPGKREKEEKVEVEGGKGITQGVLNSSET